MITVHGKFVIVTFFVDMLICGLDCPQKRAIAKIKDFAVFIQKLLVHYTVVYSVPVLLFKSRLFFLNIAVISSIVLPFVSGTLKNANIKNTTSKQTKGINE